MSLTNCLGPCQYDGYFVRAIDVYGNLSAASNLIWFQTNCDRWTGGAAIFVPLTANKSSNSNSANELVLAPVASAITAITNEAVLSETPLTAIELYPNPVTSVINVTAVSEKATFKVYNLSGQTMLSGILSNGSVDVSTINSGIYFIEITDKEITTVKRFIKQ